MVRRGWRPRPRSATAPRLASTTVRWQSPSRRTPASWDRVAGDARDALPPSGADARGASAEQVGGRGGQGHRARHAGRRPRLRGRRGRWGRAPPPDEEASLDPLPADVHRLAHALAPTRDLREWIALLDREGELRRISAEVDPDLEITEIVDRVVKAGGPALLFEHPAGSQHQLLINQFGSERRMCLALGVESLDLAAGKP